MLAETPCTVHSFDPTLSDEERKSVQKVEAKYPRFSFHSFGLGNQEGSKELIKEDKQVLGSIKPLKAIMSEPPGLMLAGLLKTLRTVLYRL